MDGLTVATGRKRLIVERKCPRDLECSICLQSVLGRTATHTPCGHTFHTICLRRWGLSGRGDAALKCPICRCMIRDPPEVENPSDDEFDSILVDLLMLLAARRGFLLHDGSYWLSNI